MQEIETRIMDIDIDNIRKILIDNGAENIKKEDQINDIYDFEDGKLLNNKGYARIRTVTDNINNKVVYYMTTKKCFHKNALKSWKKMKL